MGVKDKKVLGKFPIWAIVVILVAIGLIVAGIVCFVLIRNGAAEDLRKAKDVAQSISETKPAVEAYFAAKSETVEVSDENKELFEDFENAVAKANDLMEELGERQVVKDGEGKTKYEAAVAKFDTLRNVGETEQMLMTAMSDGSLSDEELDEFVNGKNEYLQNLAKEYKEFRAGVAAFNEKYADLKGKDKTELDADYAKIQQDGNELAQKYTEIKFDDVYGMSRDDILNFYATIEELNKYLAEKN